MLDVDLAEIDCDLYTNSLHKWFLGPAGTGFLYVSRAMQPSFTSLYASARDTVDDARRFETQGTYDLPVRAALGTAPRFPQPHRYSEYRTAASHAVGLS